MNWTRVCGTWLLLLLATSLIYGGTLDDGLRYDDWHHFRPWSWHELQSVWHGSWDPTGTEAHYFRPISAWWYALTFWVFGLNVPLLHVLSLVLHASCASMLGVFVRREGAPVSVAAFAALLYVCHPSLVYAQTGWLTNQMHALASVSVLASLLVWQTVRTKPITRWWPLVLLGALAFCVKEDTIVLLPLIGALGVLRALILRDRSNWAHLLMALGLSAGIAGVFLAFRGHILNASVPWPSVELAWTNYERGLRSVLRLLPARRPWQGTASALATGLIVLALPLFIARLKKTPEAAALTCCGIVGVLAFNAPFILISKAEQYHLLALGACMTLAGVGWMLIAISPARLWQGILATGGLALLLSLSAVSRHITGDFAPCHPITLATDRIVQGWGSVPPDVHGSLARKLASCEAGQTPAPVTDTPTFVWGATAVEFDGTTHFQWTDERATVLANLAAPSIILAFRHPAAHPGLPAAVRFSGQGQVREFELVSAEWQYVTIPIRAGIWSKLRGMARIDISVESQWVPEGFDPTNPRARRLGVQIQVLAPLTKS